MTRVINIGAQTISLDHIKINPGDSHTWLNSEMSFSLRRKIIRLRGMGLIQIEEYSDLSDINIDKSQEEITEIPTEEIKPEVIKETPKPRRRNTRKKSQRKEE